jgi:bacteriocin-like protein
MQGTGHPVDPKPGRGSLARHGEHAAMNTNTTPRELTEEELEAINGGKTDPSQITRPDPRTGKGIPIRN